MLDVFDIIDWNIESVKEYKKYLICRYFNTRHYDMKPYGKTYQEDIKYREVSSYNKVLDYYELESNYSNINLCELDLDSSPTHKFDFIKFDFNTKEDVKEYINKVKKFINENISEDFLSDIWYIQNENGKIKIKLDTLKVKDEYGNYASEFLDKASKYIIALSLKKNIEWEHMLYKQYFELDNK